KCKCPDIAWSGYSPPVCVCMLVWVSAVSACVAVCVFLVCLCVCVCVCVCVCAPPFTHEWKCWPPINNRGDQQYTCVHTHTHTHTHTHIKIGRASCRERV